MNIFGFVISFVLFVGGIYMMGEAFYVEGLESVVFIGGLLVSTAGVFIPIHVMKRVDS
ncbi:hypothetical protein I6E68_06570 [Salinibacterium sp. NSLL150]|uniref:hypothetical protein n=1 Tax=unclassified Salinibacterium TaxID=2632331 RepID=UPI0018CE7A0D|nr:MULTISPECIES: hypothetical protein [unclassified Salinibacterium]MBH0023827.1 hypothetical protein [Salinibacterium sp. SWN248]MBH0098800.1 hypothetical protein [Salinibacterium sp. NSLL35]MBH0101555.1 hypothetical protein [Salinibacterium sp. NSLL150]MBH0104314.1 hypothetical protein [Salinibacterium sp. NSLL16]MBH0107075.1 hypothetical protein [Salinibacterium sp. NSLL17]